MAANLLSSLYHEIIQADQMQKGFKSLLNNVDDLKLDVPSAEDDLALFLARGVIDDILPPAFLHKLPCGEPHSSSCIGNNTCAGRHINSARDIYQLSTTQTDVIAQPWVSSLSDHQGLRSRTSRNRLQTEQNHGEKR